MTELDVVIKAIETLTKVKETLESGEESTISALVALADNEQFTSAVIGDEVSTITNIIGLTARLSDQSVDTLAKFLSNTEARKQLLNYSETE